MTNRKTYVRVFDDIADHPGFMDVGAEGLGLWLMALTYCSRNLTDGHFPAKAVRRWVDRDSEAAHGLLTAGRWHEPGHDCGECPQPADGYVYVHGYLRVQRSKADVEALSSKRAEAGRAGGEARARQVAKQPSGNAQQTSGKSKPDTDTDTTTTPPARADALADGFTEFWSHYPNRKSRKTAERAWTKALKVADRDTIMAGLAAQLPEWRAHPEFPRYVPMASTWLNQERWTDEVATLPLDGATAPVVPMRRRELPPPPPELAGDPRAEQEWLREQAAVLAAGGAGQ